MKAKLIFTFIFLTPLTTDRKHTTIKQQKWQELPIDLSFLFCFVGALSVDSAPRHWCIEAAKNGRITAAVITEANQLRILQATERKYYYTITFTTNTNSNTINNNFYMAI